MPDTDPKQHDPTQFISHFAGPEWTQWAYCSDEQGCGHNARIDIAAIVAKIGDVQAATFRARLRCSKCGGRARLVIGHSGPLVDGSRVCNLRTREMVADNGSHSYSFP